MQPQLSKKLSVSEVSEYADVGKKKCSEPQKIWVSAFGIIYHSVRPYIVPLKVYRYQLLGSASSKKIL